MLKKRLIKICLGSSCYSRGNRELVPIVQKYIQRKNLEDKVEFSGDHCFEECSNGPNIRIDGRLFQQVNKENIQIILEEQLKDLI
ncbi:MAG: (2Fe-2S) ferredoxin domain-containing protein [Bacteroidales bacterium]|nr:(2Fe-2S) ferredoxin domain-containing protein [Bacteroidales bacterium]MBN2819019.1 (2Fe-2S) ferredoxin domain-containing protein [Bacteroidales bacterium]